MFLNIVKNQYKKIMNTNYSFVFLLTILILTFLINIFRAYFFSQERNYDNLFEHVINNGFTQDNNKFTTNGTAELIIPLTTQSKFIKGSIELSTTPNSIYTVSVGFKKNEKYTEVESDVFFNNYIIDLTRFLKNKSKLWLKIKAVSDSEPAILENINLTLRWYSIKVYLVHFFFSLFLFLFIFFLAKNTDYFKIIHKIILINILLLSIVQTFFLYAFDYASIFNLIILSLFLLICILNKIYHHKNLFINKSHFDKIISFCWARTPIKKINAFLIIYGIFFFIFSIPFFQIVGLNQEESWRSGFALKSLIIFHIIIMLISFFISLSFLQKSSIGKINKSFSINEFKINFKPNIIIYVFLLVILTVYFGMGLYQISQNFGETSVDAFSYFQNMDLPWSNFLFATKYRAPLLTYINKLFYSLFDLPLIQGFMRISTFYIYILFFLIMISLVMYLFKEKGVFIAGIIIVLLYSNLRNSCPFTQLDRSSRLYPFMTLLTINFYLVLVIFKGKLKEKGLISLAIPLAITMGLTCLIRPESLYFYIPLMLFLLIVQYKKWKIYLLTILLFIITITPYHYSKRTFHTKSNLDHTAKWWRNWEFQNQVGQVVSPERKISSYYGKDISMKEYFFDLHNLKQVTLYTFNGYMGAIFTRFSAYIPITGLVDFSNNRKEMSWIFSFIYYVSIGSLLFLGFIFMQRKYLFLSIVFVFATFIPNAFMNHLHSPSRHILHLWPFLLLLTIHGFSILMQIMKEPNQFFSNKLTIFFYFVLILLFMYPGIFPDLLSYDKVNMQNNYENNLKGARFQKYYLIEDATIIDDNTLLFPDALFPGGKGKLTIYFSEPIKLRIVSRYLEKKDELKINNPTNEYEFNFHTNKIRISDIQLESDFYHKNQLPAFIKISSIVDN
ncbi:MAG: hypothetical protein MJB14_19440 [Spirochaetes bacterium]|nr:hypothetical protein [Spirochaetota bacterium]